MFPDLTVEENIFIGRQPLTQRAAHRPSPHALAGRRRSSSASACQLDPGRIARGLSIAEQQIVEIAQGALARGEGDRDGRADRRAVGGRGRAALPRRRELRAEGAAVLFISHRLEEVFVSVSASPCFRDGRLVLSASSPGLTSEDLVRAMVGRDLPERESTGAEQSATPCCSVERLTREGVFADVSFEVKRRRDRCARGARRRRPERGRVLDLRDRPLRRRHASR